MKYFSSFFFLFSLFSLQSMERIPLLEENRSQNNEIIRENKQALVRHLYPKLFLLQRAISIPKDILIPREIWGEIYTKMVDVMFEGDKEFKEKFYNQPDAFQLYRTIKKVAGDKPLAPLYKMDQKKRDDILSQLNPWFGDYIDPVMSIEEQQIIHELDGNVRQYFVGKTINSVPDPHNICKNKDLVGIVTGVSISLSVLIGSIFCCVNGCVCSLFNVGVSSALCCGAPLVIGGGSAVSSINAHCYHSQKVTL
jgi:hypothetical protein